MKTLLKGLMLVALASSVTACGGMNGAQRDTATGAVVGGVAGNLIGGNTTSTLVGAALGGLVGSQWNAPR